MLLKTEILIESLFLAVDSPHSTFSPWWSEMWVGTEAGWGVAEWLTVAEPVTRGE